MKEKLALLSAAIGRLIEKSTQKATDEVRDEKVDGLYYLLLSLTNKPKDRLKIAAVYSLEIFE